MAGPAIGGLAVLFVALLSGYGHMWWLLIFLLVWRCIQDYVTSPRIMGTTLELHPLTVLFGVFAGGEVAGVIGVFLSIPVLAHTANTLAHVVALSQNRAEADDLAKNGITWRLAIRYVLCELSSCRLHLN